MKIVISELALSDVKSDWLASCRYLLTIAATILFVMVVPLGCSDDDNVQPDAANTNCEGGTDLDGDGYGPGCLLGEDCDDEHAGITGPCEASGCPQGFVEIPAGDFEMGCNDDDNDGLCRPEESPRHVVTMTAYCIETNEVTVANYRRCVSAGICDDLPLVSDSSIIGCNYAPSVGQLDNHPVNCIGWNASRHYCQEWLGGDLPSEAQWEKAARGTNGARYPWGDSPDVDCSRANYDENGDYDPDFNPGGLGWGCNHVEDGAATWEVGSFTAGQSLYGANDMLGNVEEWVLDCFDFLIYDNCLTGCEDPVNLCTDEDPVLRVVRGWHAWDFFPDRMTTATRFSSRVGGVESDQMRTTGYRCVR